MHPCTFWLSGLKMTLKRHFHVFVRFHNTNIYRHMGTQGAYGHLGWSLRPQMQSPNKLKLTGTQHIYICGRSLY